MQRELIQAWLRDDPDPATAAEGFTAVVASDRADPETRATAQKELETKAPQ